MARIYKYPLKTEDVQKLFSSENFKPLSVHIEDEQIHLWAEVDDTAEPKTHVIRVVGTGHVVPENCDYIGTVQYGYFVLHVYIERLEEVVAKLTGKNFMNSTIVINGEEFDCKFDGLSVGGESYGDISFTPKDGTYILKGGENIIQKKIKGNVINCEGLRRFLYEIHEPRSPYCKVVPINPIPFISILNPMANSERKLISGAVNFLKELRHATMLEF